MSPATKYKIKVVKDTLETIGILIGAAAMASRYIPLARTDLWYTLNMFKKGVEFIPDFDDKEDEDG